MRGLRLKKGLVSQKRNNWLIKLIAFSTGIFLLINYHLQTLDSSEAIAKFVTERQKEMNQNIQNQMKLVISSNSSPNPKKLIYVTPLSKSLLQQVRLTRIAQALFPLRDQIIWLIILDAEEEKNQIKLLEGRLTRFGIPYVLLERQKLVPGQRYWFPFRFRSNEDFFKADAFLTGLLWSLQLQTIQQKTDGDLGAGGFGGVILFAQEDSTFNSNFLEVILKDTQSLSIWPQGLTTPNQNSKGFSSPIVFKDKQNKNKLAGYLVNGKQFLIWKDAIMEIGSFAMNLDWILKEIKPEDYSKLFWDGGFYFKSIGISLDSIQPLLPAQINSWRTTTMDLQWYWTSKIKLISSQINSGTNLLKLFNSL